MSVMAISSTESLVLTRQNLLLQLLQPVDYDRLQRNALIGKTVICCYCSFFQHGRTFLPESDCQYLHFALVLIIRLNKQQRTASEIIYPLHIIPFLHMSLCFIKEARSGCSPHWM